MLSKVNIPQGELSASPFSSYTSSSSSSSSSASSQKNELEEALSLPQHQCNLLIPQLFTHNLLTDNLCNFCHLSVHLHQQTAPHLNNAASSITSVSSNNSASSQTKLSKSLINDLPIWRKPYKTCTPFFKALEQLFAIHGVTDETSFKRYLYLSLSELSDADKTYAFENIINSNQSWDAVKASFSKRFEAYDYMNKLRKQFHEMKYSSQDTIQTFSHRYINVCSELSYDVDSQQIIHDFLSHLPTEMHRRFLMRCENRDEDVSDFETLDEIVLIITKLENAFHNAAFMTSDNYKQIAASTHHGTHRTSLHVKQQSHSSSTKSCVYHPDSKSHSTSECSKNPKNMNLNTHKPSHKSPTSSPFKPSILSSPGKSQPICHSCGMPGHYSPQCPNKKVTSTSSSSSKPLPNVPSTNTSKPFYPPTMTRSAYVANNVQPAASLKVVDTTSATKASASTSSSDVAFKTIDRTIPHDICSLDVNEHPLLLPITIQGKTFYGLPDTGASSSCLDPLIPALFGLSITPVKGKVKNADVRVQSDRIGTCDIAGTITIPHSSAHLTKVKLKHTFEVFPVYEADKGYHFLFGRDILWPIFNKGLDPSLFTPDSHIKLPEFEDETLAAVVDSLKSTLAVNSLHTSSLTASTVHLNPFRVIDVSDVINIDVNQTSIIQEEFTSFDAHVNQDIQSLSSDIHDLGAGSIPQNELPVRPVLHSESTSTTISSESSSSSSSFDLYSTTPDTIRQQYSSKLNTLLVHLCVNEAITGFCSLPGSQVELIIDESKKHLLFRRQYPIPQTLWALANDVILRWFNTGKTMLAPVGCEFNLPLTIAPKKDDNGQLTGIRVCLDTRILNSILVSTDKFLIPQIRDTIAMFAHCDLFGEFDLSEAYLQFPLHPDSRKYTAFTWNGVQYMFVGVPFGINFIPSHFQRQLSQLFHDLPFTIPYFDNLPFGSKTWDEHLDHAITIVDRLNQVNLKIKPSSVKIGRTSMKCLGHILSVKGIGIDPEKVQSISQHPYPPTGDNMMVFLGETGYISDHIRNYAKLSAPLQAVKFQRTIEWTDEMKLAFDTLKHAVCNAPFLQFPDFSLAFHLATDASYTGIGGVLYQPRSIGEHITANNIVAIFSKVLSESQRRYPAYKKELYGIVSCLRRFHSYIWGS